MKRNKKSRFIIQ